MEMHGYRYKIIIKEMLSLKDLGGHYFLLKDLLDIAVYLGIVDILVDQE